MPIQIRWLASASTSCFHAVELLSRGQPLVDAALADALAAPTAELMAAVNSLSEPPANFFAHVVPLSATIDSNRQLADVTLMKAFGSQRSESNMNRLAGLLTQLEGVFQRTLPGVVDELALRAEPLREQWEARGPGLLTAASRLTEPGVIVESADVILVHPAQGGGGAAHLWYNSVRIEAVLANPMAELPEVVRLGWLLSQVNADLPYYQGEIHRDRLRDVIAAAMVPVVLTAAADVELSRLDERTLAQAIAAWRVPCGEPEELAGTLNQWWETYSATRPGWMVALAALDRML